VAALLDEPAGLSAQAAQAVGYAEMIQHLQGRWGLEEAIERIKINTRQLAKHQRTWFRRFPVRWIDAEPDTARETIAEKALEVMQSNK
jgi:tRNA dimethylallyltransferase